ncbi:MAG: asparaginase [Planifilum sp.]|jgi:L-asparaginase
MRRVLIITTGGTIAMGRDASGAVRVLDENVLVQQQSALASVAHVDFFTFSNLPSVQLTLDHYIRLRQVIRDRADAYDGIVVTHGTDTLEETAYFLDLTLSLSQPVVLTGAMRSSNEPGSDGFLNLLQSVQVAAAPESENKGVLVVMNGEIHGARFVQKMHASHVEAFRSPQFGPYGLVERTGIRYLVGAVKREYIPVRPEALTSRIPMIKAGFDTDDALIHHALDRTAPALVVEGMGMGHLPPAMRPGIIRALREGVPVVLTSRSPEGAVESVYDFEGGGRDLAAQGIIFARGYPAHKARIKLMVALAADPRPKKMEELRELFSR